MSRERTAVGPRSNLLERVQITYIQDGHESTGSIQEEHYFPFHLNALAMTKIHIWSCGLQHFGGNVVLLILLF